MSSHPVVIDESGRRVLLRGNEAIVRGAIEAGLQVKIGETYGMAQRGGPVMSHIQIGGEAYSPQIRPAEADVLLGFELGEAVRRSVTYLKNGGLAIVNSRKFPPVEVISGMMPYPEEDGLLALLGEVTDDVAVFDATALAEEAGDPITTNVVMLGALTASGRLPFTRETVLKVLRENLRSAYYETNVRAFEFGMKGFGNSGKR